MIQYLPGFGSTGPFPLLQPILQGGYPGYMPQYGGMPYPSVAGNYGGQKAVSAAAPASGLGMSSGGGGGGDTGTTPTPGTGTTPKPKAPNFWPRTQVPADSVWKNLNTMDPLLASYYLNGQYGSPVTGGGTYNPGSHPAAAPQPQPGMGQVTRPNPSYQGLQKLLTPRIM